MKNKILVTMLAVTTLASLVFAQKGWVSLDGGTYGAEPQITVLESGLSGVTLNLKISGMWVERVVETDMVSYDRITLPGAWHTEETGKPMLPVIKKKIAVPLNAGVEVQVVGKKTITLKGYHVYPAQVPETDSGPRAPFAIDRGFYGSDVAYPVELAEASAPSIMRDVRLVEVALQPFQYNPLKKELTVLTDVTVRIEYSGYDSRNVSAGRNLPILPEWERLYRAQIINFDNLYGINRTQSYNTGTNILPGYLIIYAHNFSGNEQLDWFIYWKERKGYHVDAVDLNTIPGINGSTDDVTDLRNYISNWYNYPEVTCNPSYVLLVGDAPVYHPPDDYDEVQRADDDHVPTYAGWDYSDGGKIYSDTYYQLLAGNDYDYEIAIGRWCARDVNDLYTYADKIWWYEFDPSPSSTWNPDEILLVAHKGSSVNPLDPDYEACKEDVASTYLSGYVINKVYGSDPAVRNQDVIDVLQYAPGVGVVNYRGHGLWECWSDWNRALFGWNRDFTTSDVWSLSHYYRFPIVYNICCSNGCIPATSDGVEEVEVVVEAWTRNPYGGAVAAFGASRPSASVINDELDKALFEAHYVNDLNCGMAINYGKEEISPLSEEARMYYWIGDPELDVWRADPQSAYIDGPSYIPAFSSPLEGMSCIFTVKRSSDDAPIAGAMVCLYKEGEYHQYGYTAASGQIMFNISGPLSEGTMIATATCQKEPIAIHPAFASIPVVDQQLLSEDVKEPPTGLFTWQLESVHPNPFRSSVTISYSVAGQEGSADSRFVDIRVFDMSGRQVKSLASGRTSPGHYEVMWDGRDDKGMECSAGIYFVRMRSVDYQSSERIILVK